MKKIKAVFSFEYLLILKSKSFLFVTVFLVLLCLAVNIIPGLIASLKTSETEIGGDDSVYAAYIDAAHGYDQEVLLRYYPEVTWIEYDDSQYNELINKVEEKSLLFGLRFNRDLSYDLIVLNPPGVNIYQLNDMVKNVYLEKALMAEGWGTQKTEEILAVTAEPNIIILGEDENAENFKNAGYLLMIALLTAIFIPLVMYGKYIAISVVNEKTSRTVEILFTCAKPTDIIFGKVFGVGMAVLTQAAIVVMTFYLSAAVFNNPIKYLMYTGAAHISFAIADYIYIFIFFLLAYFAYFFLYAGFGSISKEAQDVNSVIVIPSFLCAAGFYIAIFLNNSMGDNIVRICSFIPFLSPLNMISRVCITHVPFYEVFLAVLVNIATLIIAGIISAKIYQKYILMYGQKFSLRSLFSKGYL